MRANSLEPKSKSLFFTSAAQELAGGQPARGGLPQASRDVFEAPARRALSLDGSNPRLSLASGAGASTYVVRWGDTLGAIAQRFGTTVDALMQANGLTNPNLIFAGQVLTIPGNEPPAPPPPPSGNTTYTVQWGDTLGGIAQRFGTTVDALMQANGLTNPNLIYAGQVLTIPSGTPAPTPTPTPNPTPAPGPIGELPNTPNQQFTLEQHWPHIEQYANQYGFDPKVLAGMIFQESSFKNHLVHMDGTGHGLLGLDDNGLLSDFEGWVRRTQPGQAGYSAGRGQFASSIPPDWQIEYAAQKLASFSNRYGGPLAAARAWHRGEGLMNDAAGWNYQALIQGHMSRLFPGGQVPGPAPVPGASGVVNTVQDANRYFLNQWGPTAYNDGSRYYGPNDCGPTSGAMVLAALGITQPAGANGAAAAIDRVRDAALGYDSNSSQVMRAGTLASGLRGLGANVVDHWGSDLISAVDASLGRGHPVILGGSGVWAAWGSAQRQQGNYLNSRDPHGHFVSVLGKTAEGLYLVGDPLVPGGALAVDANALRTFYSGGFGILEVSRP